ncbi:MAG: hypothetical protein IPG17_29680 [Sandaracinaceae bacterium]|nr:hypothetical protein [Sandaracinaceae bacterium]
MDCRALGGLVGVGWSRRDRMITSNGFSGGWRSTQYGCAAEVSLVDRDGRLPEAMAVYSAHHHADLPQPQRVAAEAVERATRRLGSRPAKSGRYPMLLESSARRAGHGVAARAALGPVLSGGAQAASPTSWANDSCPAG